MPLDTLVYLYLSSKGNKKVVAGAPIPLLTYQKLSFAAKELHLNKVQIDKHIGMEFIDQMYLVHLGIERYKSTKMNEMSTAQVGSSKIIGNKKIEKIL